MPSSKVPLKSASDENYARLRLSESPLSEANFARLEERNKLKNKYINQHQHDISLDNVNSIASGDATCH